MTDSEIIVLAADFKSTSMACGVMVDDFDAVGFARAIEQASRRAALEESWEAVHAERLTDPTDSAENIAYNVAVQDCESAIRALAASDIDGGAV